MPNYLDDNYLLTEIQRQFSSVHFLHRIRTSSATSHSSLVRVDFQLAQECDQCLANQYLSVANVRLVVKQYLGPPRIAQCQKCCAFGHFSNHCTSAVKICGKCATPISATTQHECASTCCVNCMKSSLHHYDTNHEAFDTRCPSMLTFKKMLVTKLVDANNIAEHIYVPKELQSRLQHNRAQLPRAAVIPPRRSLALEGLNPWTANRSQVSPITSPDLPVQPLPSPTPNFLEVIHRTVKPHEDQLSNLGKQMSNLTMLSVIQEHKVDYVTSLVAKIMLPSFKLISDTLPTLIRLLPDSSIPSVQRDELNHQLRSTSLYLQSAYDQQQNFKQSFDHTKALMIDSYVMTIFSNRSLPLNSSINVTALATPLSSPSS